MKNLFPQMILKLKYILARLQRRRLNHVTFIGITGSVGKTTTKDLTAAVLGGFSPCRQSQGSYNTLASVAGTVWYTNKSDCYCVAEVAAYGPGTMDLSARLLKPDIAVITQIGRDHYSAYKSMDALAAEKEKLVLALPPEGTAVLNMDDPLVRAIGERCNRRVIWFGEGEGTTLHLLEARSQWPDPLNVIFAYQNKTYEVRTQLHGAYLATSVLASLGVALAANLPLEKAISVLVQATPPTGRMQAVIDNDGVAFIRDDFKAPYWSSNAPFEFLKEARAERKVAVIGMISDSSGDYGPKYKSIARTLLEIADLIVFIGPHANRALRGDQKNLSNRIKAFLNIENAARFLNHELRKGDLVLLKGTNEQDHLVRLILNRRHPIHCWDSQCGLHVYCDACYKLNKPRPNADIADFGTPPSGPTLPVIVGLGNPGLRFRRTPHNVGYRVLDKLAQSGNGIWRKHPEGSVCTLDLNGAAVQLFKPGTAMNNSGILVRRFLTRNGCRPQNCIIVHDDMNFSLGNVRLKSQGGDAGHKGMRSILSAFDTENIPRVRLGVGMPAVTSEARQFVLTKFSAKEEEQIAPAIEQAATLLREYAQKHWGDKISKG
jgi:aminoacyl-tRNA hydrolase